jgi:RNA 2',3'-cyclic 3'-phosphodiesterase
MSFPSSDNGRLFFAVVPDAVTAARIYRLATALKRVRGFDGKLVEQDRLHVTLFSLDLSEHAVQMASEAASEVSALLFDVSFDRTASFRVRRGDRPFVLLGDEGLQGLSGFRRVLGAAMTRNGLRRRAAKDFTPHVTLLYDQREVEEQPIEPISWTVRDFVLVHSRQGHVHLARWPLGENQPA